MKLSRLFERVGVLPPATMDTEITSITNDSRRVTEGSLFVSVTGRKQQNYGAYIEEAQRRGAVAVVTQEKRETASTLPQILVPDVRKAYALMSAAFFGDPAEGLTLIGVTGTNGKTSSSYYTKSILEKAGYKTGLIGTVETLAGDEVLSTGLTTPEPFELHGILAKMKEKDIDYVVMECSSQALDQHRLDGLHYKVVGFTNLTQDHLDYHESLKNYRDAKGLLFTQTDRAVVNLDDRESEFFTALMGDRPVTAYSVQDEKADFFATDLRQESYGSTFTLCHGEKRYPVTVQTPGGFAVSNALCAIGMAVAAGVTLKEACKGMSAAPGVKGRAELCYKDDDMAVLIDYAHTPDAVMNILKAVETRGGRKIALFGCGGDRDSTKRPLMASMAARYADLLIITSDNPRSEDPQHIIDDILLGLHNTDVPYITIPDRREAIAYALKNAQKGDTIFLLGKGHEDYQILSTGKIRFDEREIVADILREERK